MIDVTTLPDSSASPEMDMWFQQIFRKEAMERGLPASSWSRFSNPNPQGFSLEELKQRIPQMFDFDDFDDEYGTQPNEETANWRLDDHFAARFPGAVELVAHGNLGQVIRLYEWQDMLLAVNVNTITVVGKEYERCEELVKSFLDGIPSWTRMPLEDNQVAISLWMWQPTAMGGHPDRINQDYLVPTWEEIQGNYPPDIAAKIGKVMAFTAESKTSGRVVLLHGVPGTGKTHVIRALAREWKDWASCHYITDAENFFGNPVYMTTLAFQEHQGHVVFVVEDCGEFITEDGDNRHGQSLARLLNLADGILGQNLNLTIVMTTNEDIGDLHPALSRPGRCAAQIEFKAFNELEAEKWLANQGSDTKVRNEMTLAELYAEVNELVV